MINKLTIAEQWKRNPETVYFIIQNPRIDGKRKTVLGLPIKIVEYKVRDWEKDFVFFERIDKNTNKRFPEILAFNKRSADAETEVYSESDIEKNKKVADANSYGIFPKVEQAMYHKTMRLHNLAELLSNAFTIISADPSKKTVSIDDKDKTKPAAKQKKNKKKVDLGLDEIKKCFHLIQDTDYFDKLEQIQCEHPEIASM